MEEELKKLIDAQIAKNNLLKEEINNIQKEIDMHKDSINKAKVIIDDLKSN